MGEIPACLEYLDLAMDKILKLRWGMSFDQEAFSFFTANS